MAARQFLPLQAAPMWHGREPNNMGLGDGYKVM